MAAPVLSSKLQIPIPSAKTLDRPRLRERLAGALRSPVTLVAADAGFGKSTVVASFLTGEARAAVWYRLDAGDGDPAVFASHLLQGLRPHLSRNGYQSARHGLGLATDWTAAGQLLSLAAQRVQRDVVIALDDFHLLVGAGLAEGMTRWIEALPRRLHLAILTRIIPDLPLPRWRVEGRLAELGADDLRFTVPELRALLVDLHGLPLSDTSLQVIAAKTEGWPAGIVLALHAATAQGPAEAARALGALSGSSRAIYDYLAQEAFARQSAETQRFLLATGAVARFTPTMADALVAEGIPVRQILDHLERGHLFIVPLDRERRWYRYHHLFQEFLQRTAAEGDATWLHEVHRRAASWWERNGEPGEALHHLVEAGEFARAGTLLSGIGLDMVPQGRIETVRRWLERIPRHVWDDVPRLHLLHGVIAVVAGEARTATGSLEEARRRLRDAGDTAGELYALRWLINVVIWEGGDDVLAPLIPAVAQLESRLEAFPPPARAVALELMARVALARGDVGRAGPLFERALATGRTSGDEWTYLGCARYRGEFLATVGRFREAGALFEEMLAVTRRHGWWHEHAHFRVELADALLYVGDDDEAERHLAEARLLQPGVPCRLLEADLALNAARWAARQQAVGRAETLLREVAGEGESGTRYARFRFDAWLELASLLAAREPAEARRLAARAVGVAHRFDPFRSAQALLIFGVTARAEQPCGEAGALFRTLGVPHWSALALLHGLAVAPAETKREMAAAVGRALGELGEEAWDFLRAEVPPEILAPYRADPALGQQVARLLRVVPSASRIAVRCLGAFEVVRDNQTLPPGGWQRAAPRRLLQYLLVQDRPVHREEITEALWPELESRHAANQLRVALSHLRRILEPELPPRHPSALIHTWGPSVGLARDRLDVDLDRFRGALVRASTATELARRAALGEAMSLYAGDLFADDPYEEWAQPARGRLSRQYLDAAAELAQADEAAQEYQAAVLHWQAIVDLDPAAEHAYRGLMRSFLALGRVGDALRAFEACRRALADLGAQTAPETLSLGHRIPRTGGETGR